MSNVYLTISMITNEALMVLVNNLVFTRNVYRKYDNYFGQAGAKIGAQLAVRKPPRYVGRRGQGLSVENIVESSVTVTLSTQYGCDIEVSTADMLLSIDEFSDRILKPQVATVANMVDFDGTGLFNTIADYVGTPGTVPGTAAGTSMLTYLSAGVALDNNAAPNDGLRKVYVTPQMQAYLVNDLRGLFQSATKIKEQYEKGVMGTAMGFEFLMDQNIRTQTIGTYTGTPVVDGGGQSGSSLLLSGWSNGDTLNVGDVITIAGCYKVNPQSRQTTNTLQPFVATSTTSANSGGVMTLPVYPPLTPSGQFQTVSASPANNAAVTVYGASGTLTPQGLACHRDAFTFASADLPLPNGVHAAYRISDDDSGLSIRAIQSYDIQTDQMPLRLDLLGGWQTLRNELACRICS
jgi:P22 coat protein - gene protein 5